MLTSSSDSDFEPSNISLKENKPDGVHLNSNGLDYCVRKNEGKILWFSTDCKSSQKPFYFTVVLHKPRNCLHIHHLIPFQFDGHRPGLSKSSIRFFYISLNTIFNDPCIFFYYFVSIALNHPFIKMRFTWLVRNYFKWPFLANFGNLFRKVPFQEDVCPHGES